MIKKIGTVLFVLLILSSCSVNKKDLFNLFINDEEIIVGYTKSEDIYSSFDNIKVDEDDIITSITLYPKDYDSLIFINKVEIDSSIETMCAMYNGYMKDGLCIIEKKVKGKVNRIVLYNNVLNDDLDKLDHIVISYE